MGDDKLIVVTAEATDASIATESAVLGCGRVRGTLTNRSLSRLRQQMLQSTTAEIIATATESAVLGCG